MLSHLFQPIVHHPRDVPRVAGGEVPEPRLHVLQPPLLRPSEVRPHRVREAVLVKHVLAREDVERPRHQEVAAQGAPLGGPDMCEG